MAIVTGEVIPDPGGDRSFKVVIKHGETVIAEWSVDSIMQGEQELVEGLRQLADRARKEGSLD